MDYRNMYRTGVSPEMLGGAAGPYPLLYFKLQPEIDREINDLNAKGVRTLTPGMVNESVNRIYTNVNNKYPELAGYAKDYERDAPYTQLNFRALGVDIQQGGLLLGLITLFFLGDLFFQGRRFRRLRRRY